MEEKKFEVRSGMRQKKFKDVLVVQKESFTFTMVKIHDLFAVSLLPSVQKHRRFYALKMNGFLFLFFFFPLATLICLMAIEDTDLLICNFFGYLRRKEMELIWLDVGSGHVHHYPYFLGPANRQNPPSKTS